EVRGGVVSRNVFHTVTAGLTVVSGAEQVLHNTFANISSGGAVIDQVTLVRDNIFTHVDYAANVPIAAGGFNLFDPSVPQPYSDSDGGSVGATDLKATVSFDPDGGFTPVAGSVALAHASPDG